MSMERQSEQKDLGNICFGTRLLQIGAILLLGLYAYGYLGNICFGTRLLQIGAILLLGIYAYAYAAILISEVAHLFSGAVVAGPGVSSGLVRSFLSLHFHLVLHAVDTQTLSTLFVQSCGTLYLDKVLFRSRAMAIFTGLRKHTVPTLFKAVGAYIVFFWLAFRLLHVPGQIDLTLMLLGGALYVAGTVGTACCQSRLACAVPVLGDASGSIFAAKRRGLALIGANKFWAAAAVFALLAVAVLTDFPSQVLAAGTAINAMLCTVAVVTLVAQPLLYLCSSATTTA